MIGFIEIRPERNHVEGETVVEDLFGQKTILEQQREPQHRSKAGVWSSSSEDSDGDRWDDEKSGSGYKIGRETSAGKRREKSGKSDFKKKHVSDRSCSQKSTNGGHFDRRECPRPANIHGCRDVGHYSGGMFPLLTSTDNNGQETVTYKLFSMQDTVLMKQKLPEITKGGDLRIDTFLDVCGRCVPSLGDFRLVWLRCTCTGLHPSACAP